MTFSKIVTSRCALGHYFYAGPGAWAFGNPSYGDGDGDGDCDGDENGKKATRSAKQNNDFARVSRFFCTFHFRHSTFSDYDVNVRLISSFVRT